MKVLHIEGVAQSAGDKESTPGNRENEVGPVSVIGNHLCKLTRGGTESFPRQYFTIRRHIGHGVAFLVRCDSQEWGDARFLRDDSAVS